MKTIREWFDLIPDEQVRAKALANTRQEELDYENGEETFVAALNAAFVWYYTPEGHDYWEAIETKYRDL